MMEIAYAVGVVLLVLVIGIFVAGVFQYLKMRAVVNRHYRQTVRDIHGRRN